MSLTLIAVESRKESLHARLNSLEQFLALSKSDVARRVPRKPMEGGDDALVETVWSALYERRL